MKLLFNFYSEVYFKLPPQDKHVAIREVKADCIGKLVCVKGIVTRATEVKPMLMVATYTCDTCGNETYQPVSLYMCTQSESLENSSYSTHVIPVVTRHINL